MTAEQRAVLAHIVDCYKQGGPLPSGAELMEYFGWGQTQLRTVFFAELEELGAIRRKTGAKRYGLVMDHPVVVELLRAKK